MRKFLGVSRSLVRTVRQSTLVFGLATTLGAVGCGPGFLEDFWQPPTPERPALDERTPRELLLDERSVLPQMGFSLRPTTDTGIDGELVASSTMTATFSAPVQSENDAFAAFGTAHVAFSDDEERDLSSAAITGVYAESGVVYAVLFDETLPWRYVVIAAQEEALVSGEPLDLNGDLAAAVVIDEVTGDGFLTLTGTLTTTAVDLANGGQWSGSLDADLINVTLEAWPTALFPLTDSGEEIPTAPATGTGTFEAPYSLDAFEQLSGPANFSLDVEGVAPFVANEAFAVDAGDGISSAIVLTDGSARAVIAMVDTASLVDGAEIALGTQDAIAWLIEENGDQVAFAGGTLSVTTSDLSGAGSVSGALTVTGPAYFFSCEDDRSCSDPYAEEPWTEEPSDCSTIDTLASTFAPTNAGIASPEEVGGELPPGFSSVFYMDDQANGAGLTILIPTGTATDGPFALDLSPVDFEGRLMPTAYLYAYSCDQPLEVEGGTVEVTSIGADGSFDGTMTLVIGGLTTSNAFSVASF